LARPGRAALLALLVAVAVGCDRNAVIPSATTAPSGSARPSASLPPTPSPTPDPSRVAIDAFVALVTKSGFSYQATFSGQDRHSASILTISKGLLQVHGDDVLVRVTFADASASTVVEHRYVKGKGWVRFGTFLGWDRIAMKPTDSMGAFVSIGSAADVTYLKTVQQDGKTYYQVKFRSAIVNPVIIPYTNLTDERLTKPTMTILIDPKGRPVSGSTQINGTGRISGQLQEIIIELTVTFSKVGQAVTIAAP
jgi:hypothetical protein